MRNQDQCWKQEQDWMIKEKRKIVDELEEENVQKDGCSIIQKITTQAKRTHRQ